MSEIAACVYLAARIVYIPLYVFDVIGVRSVVWIISALGILGVVVQFVIF